MKKASRGFGYEAAGSSAGAESFSAGALSSLRSSGCSPPLAVEDAPVDISLDPVCSFLFSGSRSCDSSLPLAEEGKEGLERDMFVSCVVQAGRFGLIWRHSCALLTAQPPNN